MRQHATREKIFEIISRNTTPEGISPSIREIQKEAGLASTSTVTYHLNMLRKEGRIARGSRPWRAIEIKREESRMPKSQDMKLEEPEEKPEGERTFEDKVLEIAEALSRAEAERKTTKEPDYWQGRKDGLRVALAILEPDESIWETLNNNGNNILDTEEYR